MSTVASRPTSIANSFYESEGRPSIEPTNKTKELARAIGRERDGLVPSFRPPSSWTQRSSHHDVVWNGDQDHDQDANDDQFSDAESWDGDAQKASAADLDNTASVYGHVRPTSIGSSIFAGRGAKSDRRRREVPPPLPNLPASHQHQQTTLVHGSGTAGLLSPTPQSMISPRSDASGFDTSSQYSAEYAGLADGFDLQNTSAAALKASPLPTSLKLSPPRPIKAASRASNGPARPASSSSDAENSPDCTSATFKPDPDRLPDGTLIPKMPPVPNANNASRSRKPKARRDRSPILSFDGGVAEEEKMLVELQNKLANDARRVSTLGPKVKKNAPAPWELGGEDIATTAGRPSLREALRPSVDTFENPFSRFKSRPSVDASHHAPRSPNPLYAPSGLAHASHPSNPTSLEQEANKEDDAQSTFAAQRSRSKSVSNSAVGMLKGLGLAGAAAPASKKGKLTKALRLVGGGGGGGSQPPSSPLPELNAPTSANHAGFDPVPPAGVASNDFPQSRSTRQLKGGNPMPSTSKSQADLVHMIMSTNAKYRDQARSPPLPSPKHVNGTMPSPHLGGVRSLAYKKDTLSPTDTSSFASEQSHYFNSMDRVRSRTPPTRQVSETSHSAMSVEDIAPRTSSLEDGQRFGSTPPEGESTPVGETPAEASVSRPRPASPSAHQAGGMSASSSQTSGSLPLPGNIEGVPYKLISLEEAREQARQKQSEWLASSGGAATAHKASPHLASGDSAHDELGMQRDPSSDGGQSSLRLLKNKKSGFLLRKLKKEKGMSIDLDGVSTFPSSGTHRDLSRLAKSPMPSFSVTGLDDEESDELKPLNSLEKPALQIRPVSSMFSGFAPDFLDASTLAAEGHMRETSSGSSTSSTGGLLAPHSPVAQSFRTPSPALFQAGQFCSDTSSSKPQLAEIRPTPHGTALPGPTVPGSAGSTWSGKGGASGVSRLPSLDAGASTSDTQSQFHSPANSPLTPSFHHSVHGPTPSQSSTTPLVDESAACSAPASPQIPEEVQQRARDIEAQIQELCNELIDLRVKHVGPGSAPLIRPEVEDPVVSSCPSCGCGCAEQRRLQSINEAAVLKGISVLDRGRALKPSPNMGNTGKFGGYTNR